MINSTFFEAKRATLFAFGMAVIVALLTTGLLLVGASGSASAQTSNVIVNGDAESGDGGNGQEVVSAPGWTTSGSFTVVRYDAGGGFPSPTDPGPPDRGANFFAGGPANASSSATQSKDVSSADFDSIDTGNIPFDLSGYLGGFSTDGDNATLSITFKNALGSELGTASIGPVTAADRENETKLLPRSTSGNVPTGTRQIDVLLQMTRTAGAANDGYADNLSLVITTAPVANDDPTTPGDTNYATNEDSPLTVSAANGILANDTDPQGDTLSVKDDNPDMSGIQPQEGPSNGTLTLNANGSFDYTPDNGFSGSDSFTYRATDGTDHSNPAATVTITVKPVDEPACSDGIDNDGDGKIDFDDPGCFFVDDNNETDERCFGSATFTGTPGPDTIIGCEGSRGDTISGLGGDDTISGLAGPDTISGDSDDDTISGGDDNDTIRGGTGNDRIIGGSGTDSISGDTDPDRINGGDGTDRINGGSGNDTINGDVGNDIITGGSGSDAISGSSGNDRISARDGVRDTINCGSGRDKVTADRIDKVSKTCETVSKR